MQRLRCRNLAQQPFPICPACKCTCAPRLSLAPSVSQRMLWPLSATLDFYSRQCLRSDEHLQQRLAVVRTSTSICSPGRWCAYGAVRCSLLWTPIVLEDPDADSDVSEYDWRADQGDQGGSEGEPDPSDPRAGGRAPATADGTAEASPVDRQPISAANPEGATVCCWPPSNTSTT